MNINKIRGKKKYSLTMGNFFPELKTNTIKKGDCIKVIGGHVYVTNITNINQSVDDLGRTVIYNRPKELLTGYLLETEQYNEYKQLLRDDKINSVLS